MSMHATMTAFSISIPYDIRALQGITSSDSGLCKLNGAVLVSKIVNNIFIFFPWIKNICTLWPSSANYKGGIFEAAKK